MSITDTLDRLAGLTQGWDGHQGHPPTEGALDAARQFLLNAAVVPLSDGGLQIEWHRGDLDIEVEISPGGNLRHVSIGRAESGAGYSYRRHTA